MENLSGQLVKGYDLLERIGAGGFGAVYRAYQSTIGREVAVKIILPAHANKPEFIRRFEIEAQLVARLEHLHVVPLYDYWRDPNGAFIVMRWLRGGSLSAALQGGAFDLEPASVLLDQVAAGLAAAHSQQIVHRDLKPSNILLDEDGNTYLSDFGIARDLSRENGVGISRQVRPKSRREEEILGSIQYVAPEQLRGQGATPQSDIYSLGITLYEVLSGQHPFPGLNSVQQLYKHIEEPLPRIETLDPEVAEGINEVIQKATAKNPKTRFRDPLAMAVAFRDSARLSLEGQSADVVESLSRREQEILQLIIEGNTNQEIARALFLELSTVKWHLNRIYKKLGVRSRVQAIVRARELNLIVPASEAEPETAYDTSTSITLPDPTNPYMGLRAFEPADSRHFFGREALVEQLLSRLAPSNAGSPSRSALGLASNGSERFLTIVGPSGSGKSSVIKAGLIPALWSGELEGSDKWFIVDMLPGAHPLEHLEIALTRIAADQADNLRQHLDRDAHGLARAAKLILPNDDSELVIVIDQFEELFNLVEDESARHHFMDLLQTAVSDPHSRVRVIIALRADYYDRPLQYSAFGELVRSHLETVLPLSAEELERAVLNPANQAGVTFEPGLVATIIEDVSFRPGTLPLLQYALAELFEQRDGRTLTQSAYLALGGAAGALARRAEELYQEQATEGRKAIRQMFLRLVSVGEHQTGANSDPTDNRKRVLRSELLSAASNPELLDEIIDTYAEYRLLTLDRHSATRRATVELAHEAILREWDRLGGWLDESRIDLSLHHQLTRATSDWIEADRDKSFLLRGAKLDRFDSWVNEPPLPLTDVEQSYLNACIEWREQRKTSERERIEQETRLERQSNRRLKALVGVMTVALLITVGLAIAAATFARRISEQQDLAEERDRLSLASELASAALANQKLDPELSALLTLEAAETTFSVDGSVLPEVEELLYQAFQVDQVHHSVPDGGIVAFSPDGKTLATGNDYGTVRFWDAATDESTLKSLIHPGSISDIAWSPDGQFLASLNRSSLVKLWDVTSGRRLGEITSNNSIKGLTFNPNGQQLITAGADGAIRRWDLAAVSGRISEDATPIELPELPPILETPDAAIDIDLSPDGQYLAALLPGKSIIVVNPHSGKRLLEITGVGRFATRVVFSSDNNFIASSSSEVEATVWDVRSGKQLWTVRESSIIADLAFSPDGRYLSTGTENGETTLWEMETGQEYHKVFGHATSITSLSFSLDGSQLVTSSEERITRIWEIDPPGDDLVLYAIDAHQGKVHDAIFSADGTKIASTGEDGAVKVWEAATGMLLHSLPGQEDWVNFPAFSPDGEWLAAASGNGSVTIWDTNTGEELLALASDAPAITAITFSPDGSRLAAGGQEGFAFIWDAASGKVLTDLSYAGDTIMEMIYTHGGDQIRSYDWTGLEIAWDTATGERVQEIDAPPPYWDLELTNDGERIAAACSEAYVNNFSDERGTGRNLYVLARGEGEVTGVAFNPEGTMLATSSDNQGLSLWDMETGMEKAALMEEPLGGVDFSPDGRFLATAGWDGSISVYPVSIEDVMSVVRSRLSRGFTSEECRTYLNSSCPAN